MLQRLKCVGKGQWCPDSQAMLQCVTMRCSVLQQVAVCCSVLEKGRGAQILRQCGAVFCSVLQFVGKGQGCPDFQAMLQCVAVCCSVLHCIAVCCSVLEKGTGAQILRRRQYNVAICCSVWCSVRCSALLTVRRFSEILRERRPMKPGLIHTLQHTTTHCNTLQHTATRFSFSSPSGQQNKATHTTTYCNTLKHTATHCITQKASGKDAQ